jgi:hypothetical protein
VNDFTEIGEGYAGPAGEGGTARFRQCFPAGTPILVPGGQQPIEEVAVGQAVHCWDFRKNCLVSRPVTAVFTRFTKELILIALDDGLAVEATGGHPFWVDRTSWVAAEELRPGMRLLAPDGGQRRIVSCARQQHTTTVYNFEVDDLHNYFAGESPVLVHNPTTINTDFNNATNQALQWLRQNGSDTSQPIGNVLGKFGSNAGQPIGMRFADGGMYRIEFDARSGAHINVGIGKLKGPHILFEGNEKTVETLRSRLFEC